MVVNIRTYTGTDYVYVGRAGRGHDGYFGSPIRLKEDCPECGEVHLSRGSTLPCFEAYARRRIEQDPEYRRRVGSLKGQVLACFCVPFPCHAVVLEKLAEELSK